MLSNGLPLPSMKGYLPLVSVLDDGFEALNKVQHRASVGTLGLVPLYTSTSVKCFWRQTFYNFYLHREELILPIIPQRILEQNV